MDQDVIKKLGVVSDGKIATELGCSKNLVSMKRRELQIPPVISKYQVQVQIVGDY